MKRKILVLLCLLLCAQALFAQTTKVRGRVIDALNGEGVPFVGLFLEGTTVGTSTDMEGNFFFETRNTESNILVCQILGYKTQSVKITLGAFNKVDFALELSENELTGVVVKADNRKIKRLLANIDKHRARNNPDLRPNYSCDVYNRMELDLTNPREQLRGKAFKRNFDFVFNYLDTSSVSGMEYLPVMISESVAKRYHSRNPSFDNERIVANQISGINPDANLLSQFTGSMHLKCNFYDSFVNAFDVEFPSPIQSGGLLYYNYFIVDSVRVADRKTYIVHYRPKNGISSPAFEGEMKIDAEEYALVSIHAKMKRGGNVNWLRDVVLDYEYSRLPDSSWFFKSDRLYADFSIALGDSTKAMSVIGTRQLSYSNISFDREDLKDAVKGSPVKVEAESNFHDEQYWAQVRPYDLSRKEKDIYEMVDKVKDAPLFNTLYDLVYTAINGYWDLGKIGLGPYHKIISFNNLEGARPQFGIHTSKDLSKKFRWSAYAAYGFRDHSWKGGLSYERMFSKEPTRKLTASLSYDVFQLGRGSSQYTDGNFLASILGRGNAQRLCPLLNASVLYEHEFSPEFNAAADLSVKRYFANNFVPMRMSDGSVLGSIATNEAHLRLRFSRNETVNRGFFVKKYVHTNYPVLTLDLTGSVSGLRRGDLAFLRPEISLDWKFRIPPTGMSKIHINAGTVIGKVPYPLLHLHEGNGTYVLDKTAFSCMEFFEFASDTWATLFWNHCFNGFFLGKIPLLSRLNLREEFTLKATWGSLRNENNPDVPTGGPKMLFAPGMRPMGGVPYVEVGAGISNIFKLIRVDCFWRLTHRQWQQGGQTVRARQLFAVNVGLEFRF